jgi:hypothetical protein
LSDAERARDQLIAQIASGAKVYKGGGTELFNLTLAEKVREGATDALARLFPRFGEADHKAWTSVINRARNGDDSPLRAVPLPATLFQNGRGNGAPPRFALACIIHLRPIGYQC